MQTARLASRADRVWLHSLRQNEDDLFCFRLLEFGCSSILRLSIKAIPISLTQMLPVRSVLLRGRGIRCRSVVGLIEGVTPGLVAGTSQRIRISISRTLGASERKRQRCRGSWQPVSEPWCEVTHKAV